MKNESKLTEAEKEHLGQLYKEVASKVAEASKIVGHSLGKEHFKLGSVTISMGTPTPEGPVEEVIHHVITVKGIVFYDDNGNCLGIYSEKEKICKPC